MEAQGERLLQDLVNQEKALVAKVEEARGRAREIVAEAEGEAERIVDEARTRAERDAEATAREAAAEAESERDQILGRATEAATSLEQHAEARRADAVRLVMERVLP